jgi:hypothetical protein
MQKLTLAAMLAAGALACACSTTPTVAKQVTTMTPKEIEEAGLECRRIVPIDTSIPKTICATPVTWASYERRTRLASEDLFAEGRKNTNSGRFNRD